MHQVLSLVHGGVSELQLYILFLLCVWCIIILSNKLQEYIYCCVAVALKKLHGKPGDEASEAV